MISLEFDWQTNEFMLYCRTSQLREKSMLAYEQALRLFERWCGEQLGIYTVDKVTENVIRRYICDLQERGKYSLFHHCVGQTLVCLLVLLNFCGASDNMIIGEALVELYQFPEFLGAWNRGLFHISLGQGDGHIVVVDGIASSLFHNKSFLFAFWQLRLSWVRLPLFCLGEVLFVYLSQSLYPYYTASTIQFFG